MFGVKLGAPQLLYLTAKGIVGDILASPVFVLVRRHDMVAQAVSYMIAAQTGRWATTQPDTGIAPRYDGKLVAENLGYICRANALFDCYFAVHGIEPITVWYEELVGREQEHVDRIARRLGVSEATVRPDRIPVRKQGNELNERFKARFLQEARGTPRP